jgi:ArsR family transcriptional regulator, lead/cadmium/zinc/bismuth-responsive transcriptional repressor
VKRSDDEAACGPEEHGELLRARHSERAVARAVALFRALGDEARLRTLEMLVGREACVSELASSSSERISTVSHRLRLLRSEGLVRRRREGRHIFYSLADQHVIEMIRNALDHAEEADPEDAEP